MNDFMMRRSPEEELLEYKRRMSASSDNSNHDSRYTSLNSAKRPKQPHQSRELASHYNKSNSDRDRHNDVLKAVEDNAAKRAKKRHKHLSHAARRLDVLHKILEKESRERANASSEYTLESPEPINKNIIAVSGNTQDKSKKRSFTSSNIFKRKDKSKQKRDLQKQDSLEKKDRKAKRASIKSPLQAKKKQNLSKNNTLSTSSDKSDKKPTKSMFRFRPLFSLKSSFSFAAILIIGVGVYAGLGILYPSDSHNSHVALGHGDQSNSKNENGKVAGASVNKSNRKSLEGTDETPYGENTIPSYKVAPDYPRVIHVAEAQLLGRVLPMADNEDGSMQTPLSIYDAGWYINSAKLGESGATVITGYSFGPSKHGIFANIDTLQSGDDIKLERGDGKKFTYQVVNKDTFGASSDIDMDKITSTYNGVDDGLNLVSYIKRNSKDGENETLHRVVVYAKRVE